MKFTNLQLSDYFVAGRDFLSIQNVFMKSQYSCAVIQLHLVAAAEKCSLTRRLYKFYCASVLLKQNLSIVTFQLVIKEL